MYARIVTLYVHAWCRQTFPEREGKSGSTGVQMASTALTGSFLDVFDHKGTGSHKYIPTERLNNELGLPQGAGVYGYVKMADDSYVLLTCEGPLAYWSGKADEEAAFELEVRTV